MKSLRNWPGSARRRYFSSLQACQIAAEQDPVVHFFQRQEVGVHFLQQCFAERMERCQNDVFAALANGLYDARFHFARGFFRECEPKNVFAEQGSIRFQQVADAFRDDASLAGAGASDYQQRPFAMSDGAALRVVQPEFAAIGLAHLE